MDEAHDESAVDPFDGEEEDDEEEGSYVPCPECGKKTVLRFAIDASVICELLHVAAAVVAMLGPGSRLSIRAAIDLIARRDSEHRPVLRSLLPGRIETTRELMRTTETLVRDQLRRERQQRQQESGSTERGPPGRAA